MQRKGLQNDRVFSFFFDGVVFSFLFDMQRKGLQNDGVVSFLFDMQRKGLQNDGVFSFLRKGKAYKMCCFFFI